jgi:hypothetical protein
MANEQIACTGQRSSSGSDTPSTTLKTVNPVWTTIDLMVSTEGANPQEYTGVKMEVIEWSPAAKAIEGKVGGQKVFLVAATYVAVRDHVSFLVFTFGYKPSASTGMAKLIVLSAPL